MEQQWLLNPQEFGLEQFPTPTSMISVVDLTEIPTSPIQEVNERLESPVMSTGSSSSISRNPTASVPLRRSLGITLTGSPLAAQPPTNMSGKMKRLFQELDLKLEGSPSEEIQVRIGTLSKTQLNVEGKF